MSVSFRLVSIISVKKAFDSGERSASQSEHLCRTNANLSDKGTARSHLAMGKIRAGKFLPKVSKVLLDGSSDQVGSGCNITMVFKDKKAPLPAIDGQDRTRRIESQKPYYLAQRLERIFVPVCGYGNIGMRKFLPIRRFRGIRESIFL